MFNSTQGTLPVSIPLGIGNNCGGFGNGNGFDDIIALAIIAMIFGWNGNGGGIFGGNRGGSVSDAYVLNSDFATIQRQLSDGFNSIDNALDAQNTGICNLGYTALEHANQTNMNIMQGVNTLGAQLADCCCKTQSGIESVKTADAFNTAAIKEAIKDCCCENEKIAMQNRYESAQNQCATLQAIDKLGDRIIGYMSEKDYADVKAENQNLKNQAFMQQLVRPSINPCYVTQNPYCSCGNANPMIYNGYYGTAVA